MSDAASEHILFLTGRLALGPLRKVMEAMQPDEFSYEIRNIGVSVAALMTAQMIVRRLDDLEGVDRIIVPGACRGDLQMASEKLGVPCVRGPVDLKQLPQFFGREGKSLSLDEYTVKIFAEITDAPLISVEDCLGKAEYYRHMGADVIDIGCLPDTDFPHLEALVTALHEAEFQVSVDSLDERYLLRGGRAGADYLLSLNESNQWIAQETDAVPVLIPEQPGDMASLLRLVDAFSRAGRPFYADPVLDPVHFGFTDSILRYRELRTACPEANILMGVGNLTELTEADTTGINALLFGIISELGIQAVLVTQVSPHCRSAIREADFARRIMAAAHREGGLPKGIDGALSALHARQPFAWDAEEIRAFQKAIRDRNYRIQLSEEGIHVYNREGIWQAVEPYAFFLQLDDIQQDASHAFYLGVELARAHIAWQLGKPYAQDEELAWGAALPPPSTEQRELSSRIAHDIRALRSRLDREKTQRQGQVGRSRRQRDACSGQG